MRSKAVDVPLRCACGRFRAVLRAVTPARVHPVICYCRDCQAFARHLGRGDILDPQGGTEVIQTSSGRLEILSGREQLACLRLTPHGPLRWYAACCRTPLANTLPTATLPFVGVIGAAIDRDTIGAETLAPALGPVRRVFAKFATAPPPGGRVHDGVPLAAYAAVTWLILRARLRGEGRRSPFFTAAGAPVAELTDLAAEALERARRP